MYIMCKYNKIAVLLRDVKRLRWRIGCQTSIWLPDKETSSKNYYCHLGLSNILIINNYQFPLQDIICIRIVQTVYSFNYSILSTTNIDTLFGANYKKAW